MHDGSWTKFDIVNESISVAGSSTVILSIERAANGVIIPGWNGTIAMDWTGLYPTNELAALLSLDYAQNVTSAQNALTNFQVGIQNWAVADRDGNIGIFTYGYYPVIERGNPRGILPGNGSFDWVGSIPISNQPHLYDPSSGFVFSANQIQVSPGYPYYIGWDFESGYRADQIYSTLNSTAHPNVSTMEQLQLSDHDYSSNIFLKPLLAALASSNYSSTAEFQALSSWNGNMDINSSAATVYYFWLNSYINDTFVPYMSYYNITSDEGLYGTSFFVGSSSISQGPLVEDLANWTVNYPNIQWFNNPIQRRKTKRNNTDGAGIRRDTGSALDYPGELLPEHLGVGPDSREVRPQSVRARRSRRADFAGGRRRQHSERGLRSELDDRTELAAGYGHEPADHFLVRNLPRRSQRKFPDTVLFEHRL